MLLFGPLKSGKSTLMNAIAHEYVSEVSSLPAYPCMVFVSHGATRCFDVTRYSGAASASPTRPPSTSSSTARTASWRIASAPPRER